MMPFFWSRLLTTHGSPSQASTPSVMRIMMFRQSSQGGKSFSDFIREPAMGVVPFGLIVLRTRLIL